MHWRQYMRIKLSLGLVRTSSSTDTQLYNQLPCAGQTYAIDGNLHAYIAIPVP